MMHMQSPPTQSIHMPGHPCRTCQAGSLFPIIALAIQIVEEIACNDAVDAGGGLFSSTDAYDSALAQLHQVDCTPFYGKFLGFQFPPDLRKILNTVATAMAGRNTPLATNNLLEVTDGLRRPPFSIHQ